MRVQSLLKNSLELSQIWFKLHNKIQICPESFFKKVTFLFLRLSHPALVVSLTVQGLSQGDGVFCNKDGGEGEQGRDQNVTILIRELNDRLCSFSDI